MKIEIRKDGADWTLYVNGLPRVQRESYALVDNIAYALNHPGLAWATEAGEVAESIRRSVEAEESFPGL